ncbi:MAG: nucleotidyltransferase domain-containing protein [Planctomycetes bacterium]|nr:nucleotidyltransferase domain-containing protein [Planctomycetota bacterium]
MLNREEIISGLRERLHENPEIRAIWLGGSDANKRADAWSDIDLMVIGAPGKTEAVAAAIERAVEEISPIRIRFRLPMPTWHGFEQAFYQLENAPEELMIDWLIVEEGKPHPWFEKERHGVGRVLFDKIGVVKEQSVDVDACRGAAAKKVSELRLKFPLYRHLPVKFARRGLPVDAAYFYQALVLRPLVDLLRCVHCVERHDFGFRYLRDDLPRDVYGEIERLCWPSGPGEIPGAVERASALFQKALEQWDANEMRLAERAGAPA